MLMGTAFPSSLDRLSPVEGQASSGYVPERLYPGLPQSQKAQQVVGFEGCFEALGLDTAFASSWSAQECQGEVAEGNPILTSVGQFDLRGIIAEDDVQQPVQAILDAPVEA